MAKHPAPRSDPMKLGRPRTVQKRAILRQIQKVFKAHMNCIKRALRAIIAWLESHGGLLTALASVAMAWFTWQLAIYAGHQEEIIEHQLNEMRIQAQAFNATQRAFIVLKEVKLASSSDNADEPPIPLFLKVVSIIENSGDTPTRNLVAKTGVVIKQTFVMSDLPEAAEAPHPMTPDGPSDPAQPYDPDKLESWFELGKSRVVLGPHGTTAIDGFINPTVSDVRRPPVMGGSISRSYAYGILRYHDIFPGTAEHITKFCYEVAMSINEKGFAELSHRLCRHWNCADDECIQDRADYLAEFRTMLKATGKPVPRELLE